MDNLIDTNRIIKKLNKVINLLGGINDFNKNENRRKLHKAYNLVWEIKSDVERQGD